MDRNEFKNGVFFLGTKENRRLLDKFIADEPSSLKSLSLPGRSSQYLSFISVLKDEQRRMAMVDLDRDKKAYCQYYLGELFAKCPYTYAFLRKDDGQDFSVIDLLRMKTALIYYINTMIDVVSLYHDKPRRNFCAFKNLFVQKNRKKQLDNAMKIFKKTIINLTFLLNKQAIFASAMDEIYVKARQELKKHLVLAKKIFFMPFRFDLEIAMLLAKYKLTIFDHLGVDVVRERRKACRKCNKKTQP